MHVSHNHEFIDEQKYRITDRMSTEETSKKSESLLLKRRLTFGEEEKN